MSPTHLYISVPVLHHGLFPDAPHLSRICPGLPPVCPDTAGDYLVLDWPLGPQEALATLRDIEALASSGVEADALRARHSMEQERALALQEEASVRRMLSGRESLAAPDLEIPRLMAQRALLAAWSQESGLLELDALSKRADAKAASLARILAEDGDVSFAEHAAPAVDAAMLPHWNKVLEHLALFLPAQAVLCTADPRMAAHLEEAGLVLPPAEDPDFPRPAGEPAPMLKGGSAPLWRVLGHALPVSEKPWLDAVHAFRILTGYVHG